MKFLDDSTYKINVFEWEQKTYPFLLENNMELGSKFFSNMSFFSFYVSENIGLAINGF